MRCRNASPPFRPPPVDDPRRLRLQQLLACAAATARGGSTVSDLGTGSAHEHAAATTIGEGPQALQRNLAEALWASGKIAWEWRDRLREIRLIEFTPDSAPGTCLRSVRSADRESVHPQDQPAIDDAWRAYLRGLIQGIDCTFRLRIEGAWRWVRIRGRAVERSADGRVERIAGTLRDITEQREAELGLRMLGDAFSKAREPMVLLDRDGTLREANQAFYDLLGLAHLEPGTRLAGFIANDHSALDRLLAEAMEGWREEFSLQRVDGSVLPVELALLRVLEFDGERSRLVLGIADLSLQRSVQARMRRASLQDGLTGLGNRAHFESRLKWMLAPSEATPLALLWINLDGFRAINDSLGHAAGDAFLYESAQRLLDLSAERDELARISGDEFGLLIRGEDIASRAATLAKQVIESVGAPMQMGERMLCVTASVGIALYPEDAREPDQLLQQAEAAMRTAKQRGRARAEFHRGELSTEAARRLELITELRRDIERDALSTVLQPKVSAGGYVVGYELLMRWHSERMGPVSPAAFIPLSEEFGLVGRLGVIAVEHAARFAVRLLRMGLHTPVALNLSPRQVFDPETEPLLIEVCRRHGLPHDMLELELTEGALLENIEAGRGFLRRLSEQGFRLALDDFGTGFSSLAYLRRLPFNTIKIDRCFMDDIDTDARALSLLQGMVMLCRSLDIAVVAEGVETEAQRLLLTRMGVDQMQGFLFARPQPADAVIALATRRLPLV
jgi:diguanylate cyclase (GGDEF)-like protein/PAS domain S-box-containing protein